MHRHTSVFFFLVFTALTIVFVLHYLVVGQAVYGDGRYYYAYTRSLVKDADLSFDNDLGHHFSPASNNRDRELVFNPVENRTSLDFAANKYPLGSGLSWIPTFFVTDILLTILHPLLPRIVLNGFSDPYQITVGITNVIFVTVGIVVLRNFLKTLYDPLVATITTLSLLFATNLLFYGSIDVINSHPLSFLISTVLLVFWWKTRQKRTLRGWFFLGLLCGFAALNRTQDAILLILPTLDITVSMYKNRREIQWKHTVLVFLLLTFGFLLAFTPQVVVWKLLYGSYISPYISTQEGFDFLRPHIIDVFVNTKNGLLLWNPLYFISFIGLFLVPKTQRTLAITAGIFIVATYYLVSSWSGWTQGESFGIRMLLVTLPFISIGLAAVYQALMKRFSVLSALCFAIFFVLVNGVLIVFFLAVLQNPTFDKGTPTDTTSLKNFLRPFQIKLPDIEALKQ